MANETATCNSTVECTAWGYESLQRFRNEAECKASGKCEHVLLLFFSMFPGICLQTVTKRLEVWETVGITLDQTIASQPVFYFCIHRHPALPWILWAWPSSTQLYSPCVLLLCSTTASTAGPPCGGSPLANTQYQQGAMRMPSCMQRKEETVMDQSTRVSKNPL